MESQAYDLERFSKRTARVIPLKTDDPKAKRHARLQQVLNMAVTAVAVLGIVAVLAIMIVSKVQLTEMNNQITRKQAEISEIVAQTERLRGQLAAQTSARSVEDYVQEHGMQKIDAGQKIYISVDTRDDIRAEEADNLLEQLWARLKGLLRP